jgi:rubrerythrin
VRFEFDPAPPLETLMLHFCGEVRLTQWYRRAAEWHTEPVIRHVYGLVAQDEARHAGAYLKYMRRALERDAETARAAFSKVGVLMASSGLSGKPLHPTNLHVNKSLFPNDTVQGRLPDPGWLDRWLAEQIRFDAECEQRVVRAILRSLSALFGERFETVRDLNRFRKAGTIGSRPGAGGAAQLAGVDASR